jgi:hypothetical protein
VFVPRTSSTPVATWFWQTEGRSAEREEFLSAPIHSPLSGRLIGPPESKAIKKTFLPLSFNDRIR